MLWTPTIPDWRMCLWLVPLLGALIIAAASISGWLKLSRRWRTGDTRKLFHFIIFTSAAGLQLWRGSEAVNLLGGLVAAFIALVLWRGDSTLWFEGLGRESDQPRRGLYILLPFLATAAGGICSSLLFGANAAVGIAVAGWGDAVAEPIGIRFGRHKYRVPNFGGGVVSHRSIEGSAAVFGASFVAILLTASIGLETTHSALWTILAALMIAAVSTLVEAVSHHGLDNFTLQVAASGVSAALL